MSDDPGVQTTDGEPDDELPSFCLRCQEELPPVLDDDEEPLCDVCGLPYDPADPETYRRRRQFRFFTYIAPWFALAVVTSLVNYAIIRSTGYLGSALFFGVPIGLGALLGYCLRARVWTVVVLCLAATAVFGFAAVSLQLAGLFCGLILALIFVCPVLVGGFAGTFLRVWLKTTRWSQRGFLPVLAIAGFPYLILAVEVGVGEPLSVSTVSTERVFRSSAVVVWESIVFFEQVEHEPPFLLELALPRPLGTDGSRAEVGSVVRCIYEQGHLTKQITEFDAGKLLTFQVIEQELGFERDVTLLDGRFDLQPIAGEPAATRVRLTTRYRRHLRPRWLWLPVEREVVRTLHEHVLEGMRRNAEERPSLAKRQDVGVLPELRRGEPVR